MENNDLQSLQARIETQNFLIYELSRQNREMKSLVKFVERENAKIRKRNADLYREKAMLERELSVFSDQIQDLRKAAREYQKIILQNDAPEEQ